MPVEAYLAYLATVGIFFATPPGPSQLLMIANSMRHGLRPSLATAAGQESMAQQRWRVSRLRGHGR